VLKGAWSERSFSHQDRRYSVSDTILEPKPVRSPRPTIYAGGESESAKRLIAERCDAYVMHGDPPETVGAKILDMRRRRCAASVSLAPMR
jgi:FMNH2-dependent dimethyl sulfone monooxygenase